jgi:hypothetical protein
MPVHVAENWPKHGVDVFIWQETRSGRIPYVINEWGLPVPDDKMVIPVGAELPITLFIPYEIYSELRKGIIGEALDNDDALKDARTVRDRLLTLVENDHDRMIKQADVLFNRVFQGGL